MFPPLRARRGSGKAFGVEKLRVLDDNIQQVQGSIMMEQHPPVKNVKHAVVYQPICGDNLRIVDISITIDDPHRCIPSLL